MRTEIQGEEVVGRYDMPEGNKIVCKVLDDNKDLFSDKEKQVIRYWSQWDGKQVVFSSKKAAIILEVSPQAVQRWIKYRDGWKESRHTDWGYEIPLSLIVDEKKLRKEYGRGPKIDDQVFLRLDDIDRLSS